MKILHTGDIHLDSPFSGVSPADAENAKRELRRTFSEMMHYAAENDIDMVLLAGDVFDCSFATPDTARVMMRELEDVRIPVVISPGNHDPYTENSIWKKKVFPKNVHIFTKNELTCFTFEGLGARVYGAAFTDANMKSCPLDGKRAEDDGKINLLCVHGDTTDPFSNKCPMTASAILAFGADYTALGHIHNPAAANAALRAKGVAGAYCGCPQGRDFGECGVKGAYVVTVDETGASAEFVPFSGKVYKSITAELDGAETMEDVISEVRAAIAGEETDENTLLRVTLKGHASPDLVILCDEIEKACDSGLYSIEVTDETVPSLSAEELREDKSIRGEVFRLLSPKLESEDPAVRDEATAALRYALAALSGRAIE